MHASPVRLAGLGGRLLARQHDIVLIDRLQVQAITGRDYWNRPSLQPLEVSVALRTDFRRASEADDLRYSLNYAVISRNVSEAFDKNRTRNFKSLESIGELVASVVLDQARGGGHSTQITISNKKSEIRCDDIQLVISRAQRDGTVVRDNAHDRIVISNLRLLTLIGVFTFERLQKQIVSLDIEIELASGPGPFPYHDIVHRVVQHVEAANFKTVEALVETIAQLVCQHSDHVIQAACTVLKPNAITFASGVGVQVTRTPADFAHRPAVQLAEPQDTAFNLPAPAPTASAAKDHTVFVAFGSNSGDQVANIRTALHQLEAHADIQLVTTSSLYESAPMYYLDQPNFINGVVQLTTTLSPQQLLQYLKKIEYDVLGRVKLIENGPRSIDLDILLYDELILNEPDLVIPHIRMIERTFVLQPLCELLPPSAVHPVTAEPFHNHLGQLYQAEAHDATKQKSNLLKTLVPLTNTLYQAGEFGKQQAGEFGKQQAGEFGKQQAGEFGKQQAGEPGKQQAGEPGKQQAGEPGKHQAGEPRKLTFDLLHNTHRTLIMGILNTTPDSFSDGGRNASVEVAIKNALEMVEHGVDIIDIGGVSTRPGSVAPSEQDEWLRVVPIVQAIRNHHNHKLRNVIISIDTYRSHIAYESIKHGADIINDISGGLYDEKMFGVIAQTGVPYVLNHTRGTPDTMVKLNQYDENHDEAITEFNFADTKSLKHGDEVLLNAIGRELAEQYSKAIRAGIRRWQIITDPGIGFAKNLQQNLAVIRGTPFIKKYANFNSETLSYSSLHGLPILLGPSRKKFIGHLTKEHNPSDRVLSTAAVIMSCIGYESDIVRVHDVEEVKKVTLIGDALYRHNPQIG